MVLWHKGLPANTAMSGFECRPEVTVVTRLVAARQRYVEADAKVWLKQMELEAAEAKVRQVQTELEELMHKRVQAD